MGQETHEELPAIRHTPVSHGDLGQDDFDDDYPDGSKPLPPSTVYN